MQSTGHAPVSHYVTTRNTVFPVLVTPYTETDLSNLPIANVVGNTLVVFEPCSCTKSLTKVVREG